jgi:hypothetical protein
MALMLAIVALILGLSAVAASVVALRRTRSAKRPRSPVGADTVAPDLESLRDEVQRLRSDAAETLRHLAVVRYDAFGDMGGHLSWSLALLDDGGNGVVLTSIHGRSEARTYAKNVTGWSCDAQLSPEEAEAIGYARDSSGA